MKPIFPKASQTQLRANHFILQPDGISGFLMKMVNTQGLCEAKDVINKGNCEREHKWKQNRED